MPVKYHKDENQIELIVYGNPVARGMVSTLFLCIFIVNRDK